MVAFLSSSLSTLHFGSLVTTGFSIKQTLYFLALFLLFILFIVVPFIEKKSQRAEQVKDISRHGVSIGI